MFFALTFFHLALVFLAGTAYCLVRAIYDLFYHPLSIYPGPKLWAVSRLPFSRANLSGKAHLHVRDLQTRYGPVVRVAPDELCYSHPDAWHEIMGHRGHGLPENPKDLTTFPKVFHQSIVATNPNDHARFRLVFGPRFSATSLKRQQSTLIHHVDLLIQQLREHCQDGEQPLDVVPWMTCATFDIISDLVFGESFHSLQSANYHAFVSLIFRGIKLTAYFACVRKFAVIDGLLDILTPRRFEEPEFLFPWSREQISRLLEDDKNRSIQQDEDRASLTKKEIVINATAFLAAGSETSATSLSATIFYLATNQAKLATLEIRSRFKSENEITYTEVHELPYLTAVLEESLRMYPTLATAVPRRVAKGGRVLPGKPVPENTLVSIWQWPLFRNADYFAAPNSFMPERWLNLGQYENDTAKVFRPFSCGPRDCIGKSLAYAEMRFILARIIWNFDLQLAEESASWDKRSRSYLIWQKPQLLVHLTPRNS